MKALRFCLCIPFLLGILLPLFIACGDDGGSKENTLTLSSYDEKVKTGDKISVQIVLSNPNKFSKILVKKTISGKEVSDYKKVIDVKKDAFPYTFNENVISGDEKGIVVYSFYGLDANGRIVDASDLVLTVELAELPLLLKYDWQLVQQIIQGEDYATPDLKDDVYRFNPDLTFEMDWGTVLSTAQLETLNACCSWDVTRTGEKVDSLYMVKYNVFQPNTPMITKYKVIKLAKREMVLESRQDLSALGPEFSKDEIITETYSPVSKTDGFIPYRGKNPDDYYVGSCSPGTYK